MSEPAAANTSPTITIRDYRKGNWTPEETLILITAKKLDDERRITTTSNSRAGGGELRWKWVENYCWTNGCLRSQNQCNDKWDNLLRDYKKVRDYQLIQSRAPPPAAAAAAANNPANYWAMDKTQRKQRNLPSSMLPNIFDALNDVVQRKHFPPPPQSRQQQQQQPTFLPPRPPQLLLPPEVLPSPHPPHVSEASADESQEQGDETENDVENETKRTKRLREDIGSSIINSTSLLLKTLKQHDDNTERRHNQLMELERQRIQLEETRNQVNRQGITALVTSINKLSDAIHALISDQKRT